MKKSKETKYAHMSIEEGVFIMTYKPMNLLDLGIAKEIVKERIAFKNNTPYPSLFDIRNIKSTTKDGRDYMANEGNDFVIASSLLVNSSVTKMLGNFFMLVSKPKNPTKLFTDELAGKEWLYPFIIPVAITA